MSIFPNWINSAGVYPDWLGEATLVIFDGGITIYPKLVNSFSIHAIITDLLIKNSNRKFYIVKNSLCKEVTITEDRTIFSPVPRSQTWKILNLLK